MTDAPSKTPIRALIEAVEACEWDGSWRGLIDSGIPSPSLFSTAYHGSLDAALALHEAMLPGWEWRLRDNRAWVWRGLDVYGGDEVEDEDFKGLPARAWLLEVLKAYEAQQ